MKVYINIERSDDDPMYYVVKDALVAMGCDIVRTSYAKEQRSEIALAAQGCDAALVWLDKWDDDMFSRVPSIRLILRYGAGFDQIDLSAATRHGVAVATAAGNYQAVAEGAVALMLSVCRKTVFLDKRLHDGIWRPVPVGDNVIGKTIGILGFGRIGKTVAKLLLGFDCKILAYDKFVTAEEMKNCGAKWATLEEIASDSDIVTCHLPFSQETDHILNASFFRGMKNSAYFINTARGGVMDEKALYDALVSGQIRGAGLDVYETEPVSIDNPLFKLDNVVLLPHTTSAAWSTFDMTAKIVTDYFAFYMEHKRPSWALNKEVLEMF